jgi:hypothetical protein
LEERHQEIVTGACLPHTLDMLVEDIGKIKTVAHDTLVKADRVACKFVFATATKY